MSVRAAVVIPAAGAGRRMGAAGKAFLEIDGVPVLARAIRPFLEDVRVVTVVVALDAARYRDPPAWLTALDSRVQVVQGGSERTESVGLAIEAVPADVEVIVVHDAARPLVTAELVRRVIDAAAAGLAVASAMPLTDTLHRTDRDDRIVDTPERAGLWRAQTPQAFPAAVLRTAHQRARAEGFHATDDAALVARTGAHVHVIEGEADNIKITVPADLRLAESLLRARTQ